MSHMRVEITPQPTSQHNSTKCSLSIQKNYLFSNFIGRIFYITTPLLDYTTDTKVMSEYNFAVDELREREYPQLQGFFPNSYDLFELELTSYG
jgi:hypothetical protein